MKTFSKIALVAALSVATLSANAAINYTAGQGQPYVGVKVGQFKVDDAAKDATAYGVYGGYNFGNGFGAELEYLGSEKKSYSSSTVNVDYKVKTFGAYGTYNYNFTNTPVYLKGKLGVAKSEAEATASAIGISRTAKNDDTGLAYGIGLGYSPTKNFALEAEYARIASDVDLMTLGATLKF